MLANRVGVVLSRSVGAVYVRKVGVGRTRSVVAVFECMDEAMFAYGAGVGNRPLLFVLVGSALGTEAFAPPVLQAFEDALLHASALELQ